MSWRAIEGNGLWTYEDGFDEFDPYYDQTFDSWDDARDATQGRLKERWQSEDCADCANAATMAHLELSRLWFQRRDKHVEPPDAWVWNIDGADWVILKVEP